MSYATKPDQLSIRVDPGIRLRLVAAAEQDRRPISHLVRNVLSDWLESMRRVERGVPAPEINNEGDNDGIE